MSNKTRTILKAIAVILVLLMVLIHLGYISIYGVGVYQFWIVIIAFGLLLVSSK
jgi:hypothetical protein